MRKIHLFLSIFLIQCSSATSTPPTTNSIPRLDGISISSGTLSPTFDADVYNYTVFVKNRVDEISLTLVSDNNSSFEVNGQGLINPYALEVGSEELSIVVRSPDESRAVTYTVTIHRARQFVYVSNVDTGSANDTLSLYSIEPVTGQLESLTTASLPVGDDPYDLLVSPNGEYLYVANAVSNTIMQFAIDTATGELSALAPASVAQGPTPYALAMTADSSFLYCPNGDSVGPGLISQYTTGTTGALAALSSPTVNSSDNPWFLAVTPNSQFLYASIFGAFGNPASDTIHMYSINSVTGLLTELTPATVATEDKPWHVNVDPSGAHVYVTNYGSGTVSGYAINSSTGQLTELAGSSYPVGTSPVGLTIDPFGRFVYVANSGSDTVTMFTRNSSSGELTDIGTVAVVGAPYGLETDHDGRFLYVASSASNTISQFSIHQTTGALTALSPATVTAGTNPRFIRISR